MRAELILLHDAKQYLETDRSDWGMESEHGHWEVDETLRKLIINNVHITPLERFNEKRKRHFYTGLEDVYEPLKMMYSPIFDRSGIDFTVTERENGTLEIMVHVGEGEKAWDMKISYSGSYSIYSWKSTEV